MKIKKIYNDLRVKINIHDNSSKNAESNQETNDLFRETWENRADLQKP